MRGLVPRVTHIRYGGVREDGVNWRSRCGRGGGIVRQRAGKTKIAATSDRRRRRAQPGVRERGLPRTEERPLTISAFPPARSASIASTTPAPLAGTAGNPSSADADALPAVMAPFDPATMPSGPITVSIDIAISRTVIFPTGWRRWWRWRWRRAPAGSRRWRGRWSPFLGICARAHAECCDQETGGNDAGQLHG